MRLWDGTAPDGTRLLDEAGYEALGGLQRALNDHAEEALAELTQPGQQAIAEALFRALTERTEGERDTRRPVPVREVADLTGSTPEQVIACAAPFRRLDRSLLMPPPEQDLGPDDQLDITHEALIRQWRRLQTWTQDEAARAEVYRRLESAARRRQAGKGALWIEPDLGIALAWRDQQHPTVLWAARYGGDFALAMGFLEDARTARDRALDQEERRRRAEVRRARRVAAAAVAALVVTLALAGWGWVERQRVQEHAAALVTAKRARTESLFESRLTHAALLAQGEDYAGAWRTLGETLPLDREGIAAGRRQVRNLLAGLVDLRRGEADLIYTAADAALIDLALSPDRRWLVAGGERGTLVVFDAATGALVRRLEGHDPAGGDSRLGAVAAVCFDAKGDRFYSGGADGRIVAWSVPNWQEISRWQAPSEVWSLALSPDGARLASGGNVDGITLWSTETRERLQTLTGKTSLTADGSALAWLPDGRLVSGGYDGLVGIWDPKTGIEQVLPPVHTGQVNAVAVSPDGTRIATGGTDQGIVLWDALGQPLRRLRGHRNGVLGLAFDSTNQRLISASYDKDLRLWDLASATTLRVFEGHTAGLWSVAVADGRAYTAANDGTVRRWPLDRSCVWLWDLPGMEPASVGLAPDAGLVLLGLADGALRAYGLPGLHAVTADAGQDLLAGANRPRSVSPPGPTDPYHPGPLLAEVPDAHSENIKRIAWSPDRRTMATAGKDGLARIWRPERTNDGFTLSPVLRLVGHTGSVRDLAFSPDGRWIATAGYDSHVGLFETATGAGALSRAAEAGEIESIAFTPDGTRLVTVQGEDRTLRLWPRDGSRLDAGRTIARLPDRPLSAALSPDGAEVVVVGRQFIVSRHPLDPPRDGTAPVDAKSLTGHEQAVYRAIYAANGQTLLTVSADTTLRLWDLTTGQALFLLQLPTEFRNPSPLWDFDLSCTTDQSTCWIAVPLTMGRLALYRLPYADPPPGLTQGNRITLP